MVRNMENPTQDLTMFRLDGVEYYSTRNVYAGIASVLGNEHFTREVLETTYEVEEYIGRPIGKDIGLKKRLIVGPKSEPEYQSDRLLEVGTTLEDVSRAEDFDPDDTHELDALDDRARKQTTRMLRAAYNKGDDK